MTDDRAQGPLGDVRPDASDDAQKIRPSLPQENVEDRGDVSVVTPEDYPQADRDIANPGNNRGERKSTGSGEVTGSGSGAGGGGNPEDFDDDAKNGSGRLKQQAMPSKPDTGADAPTHGGR